MTATAKRGKDTFTARITSLDIGPVTSKNNKTYGAVTVGFESSKGNTWENALATFPDSEGAFRPSSSGGLFLTGLEKAYEAAGFQFEETEDGSVNYGAAVGKVFRFERKPRSGSDFTDPVPLELIGDDFPATNATNEPETVSR